MLKTIINTNNLIKKKVNIFCETKEKIKEKRRYSREKNKTLERIEVNRK